MTPSTILVVTEEAIRVWERSRLAAAAWEGYEKTAKDFLPAIEDIEVD